jgi:hypothetical protein
LFAFKTVVVFKLFTASVTGVAWLVDHKSFVDTVVPDDHNIMSVFVIVYPNAIAK